MSPIVRLAKSRRSGITIPIGCLLAVVSCTTMGCQQQKEKNLRTAPVDVKLARGLAKLDKLCWSIRLEANMESPSDNVSLVVKYDTGTLSGKGKEFTAGTTNEVVSAALKAIEGEARPLSAGTVTEGEIRKLSDVIVEIKRRCWHLQVEKTSDEWSVMAREQLAGNLGSKTAFASGPSLRSALEEVLKELDRQAASE